jgi:hypothetical protein
MRYAPRAILAGGLGFAVSFVVACGGGSSGLLSADQSNALSNQAEQISSAVQSRNCGAAVNASAVLNSDVQTLPVTINPTLRRNLSQGASTIAQLARKDCRHTTPTQSTATASSTTTTSTSTSTATSTTTPTSTTTTSTTSTSATTPTDTGTTSTTTGGAGLGSGTTTDNGNGSGGTGPGQGDNSGTSGGG